MFGAAQAQGAIAGLDLISRADTGANPAAPVDVGGVSADGRRVAFVSADPLAGTPVGGIRQLYVRDVPSGRTLLASRTPAGRPADAPVDVPPAGAGGASLSADGRFAVFTSRAAGLVPGDTDGGLRDVFRVDLATGAVRLASASPDGGPSTFDVDPGVDLSADGSRVAYVRTRGGVSELVVSDLLRGGETLAGVAPGGMLLSGPFGTPSLSADGRAVAFSSAGRIYVRDLDGGATVDVGPGTSPSLSGDGSVVVYVDGTTVRRTVVASAATTVVAANGGDPRISADGRRVAWTSLDDSVAGDTNGLPDVYVATSGGAPVRASERAAGVQVARASTTPSMAANGGRLVFELDDGPAPSASLVAGDTDLARDVLGGTMTPADATGPAIVSEVSTGSTPAPAVTVSGRVTDPSGVAYVLVRGMRARVDTSGAFAVTLSLTGGSNVIPLRAMDGAGNIASTSVVVSHTLLGRLGLGAVPRATGLGVARSGPRTIVRFRLDRRATRVWVALARRQVLASGGTRFVAVGPVRGLAGITGNRGGLLSPKALARGIYQVRLTVVSPQGTRVVAHRFVVTTAPRPVRTPPAKTAPKKAAPKR